MKKIRNLFIIATIVVLCIASIGYAASKDKDIILGHGMDQAHYVHKFSVKFIEELTKLSNGEMTIAYHPGGDLGDTLVIMEQNIQGIVPIAISWGMAEIDPRTDFTIMPFLARNWKEAEYAFGPKGLLWNLYDDIYTNMGLKLGATIPTGFTGVVIRKGVKVPMNFPEDAKGIKIRVPNIPAQIIRQKAMGYSPVSMAYSEVHTAFQTKTIDARAGGPAIEAMHFQDVISTYIHLKDHVDHALLSFNKKWFESLSKQQQERLMAAAGSASEWAWSTIDEEERGNVFNTLKKAKINVVELSPKQQKKVEELVVKAEYPFYEELTSKEFVKDIVDKMEKFRNKK